MSGCQIRNLNQIRMRIKILRFFGIRILINGYGYDLPPEKTCRRGTFWPDNTRVYFPSPNLLLNHSCSTTKWRHHTILLQNLLEITLWENLQYVCNDAFFDPLTKFSPYAVPKDTANFLNRMQTVQFKETLHQFEFGWWSGRKDKKKTHSGFQKFAVAS